MGKQSFCNGCNKYAVRLMKNDLYFLDFGNKNPDELGLSVNRKVVVLTEKGQEIANVVIVCSKIAKQWKKSKEDRIVKFVRVLTPEDKFCLEEFDHLNKSAYKKAVELVSKHKLDMNLLEAKYTFDKKKLSFYYTAKERVDFRGLLKDLTQEFKKIRIDLRHIGVRDETAMLQGLGVCGREFCCCSFLKKFDSTNIKIAKDQGVSIASNKVTGTCGRLLCCLNYEYKDYIEAAKKLPPVGSSVMTCEGLGKVCSLNFLSKNISVKLEDGKVKEFKKHELEMVDTDVNIDINDTLEQTCSYIETDEIIEDLDNLNEE